MSRRPIIAAVEGDADQAVLERLARLAGIAVSTFHVRGGKNQLDERLANYNQAALRWPWLVLRDLDQDAECAAALCTALLPNPSPHMRLRIAVHAAEAWLLADRERSSRFLGVPIARVPPYPDELPNPKAALVEIARHSRYRRIREDMVPEPGVSARVGRGYTSRLIEYIRGDWRPRVAATNSDSLRRCLSTLRAWQP